MYKSVQHTLMHYSITKKSKVKIMFQECQVTMSNLSINLLLYFYNSRFIDKLLITGNTENTVDPMWLAPTGTFAPKY